MLSPLKLFVITAGGVVVLAVVPYGITQLTTESPEVPKPLLTFVPEQTEPVQENAAMQELPAPKGESKIDTLSAKRTTQLPVSAGSETKPAPLPESAPQVAAVVPPVVVKEIAELPAPRGPKSEATPAPTPTPKPVIQYRAEVEKAQQYLAKLGYNIGTIDGKLGQRTQMTLIGFQKDKGLPAWGDADEKTLAVLVEAVAELDKKATETDADGSDEKSSKVTVADADDGDEAKADKDAEAKDEKKEVAKVDDDPQVVILRKTKSDAKVDPGPVPTLKSVADVKKLQEKLVAANLYPEEPDGKWGEKTIAAMREFQEKYDLEVTGKPNSKTWKKMHEVASGEWTVVKPEKDEATTVADATKPTAKSADKKEIAKTDQAKKNVAKKDVEKAESVPARASEKIEISDAKKTTTPKPRATSTEKPLTISVMELAVKMEADSAEPAPAEPKELAKAETPADKPAALEVSKPVAEVAAAVPPVEENEQVASLLAPPASNDDVPILSGAEPVDVVVKVNPDAGGATTVLATPAIVSAGALVNPLTPVVEKQLPADEKPVLVKVQAPKREKTLSTQLASVPESALAEKEEVSETSKTNAPASSKLKSEVEEAQARIAMVSNDPHYELEKYAPKMLESVNGLVDKLKANAESDDPEASRRNLALLEKELEQAKQESLRRKAERKVNDVDSIYKLVKSRYADQIKKVPLADLMGKIDNGYTAMQTDFKKGNYDPIVQRCDGFKLQIEILANEAAKSYLESELDDKKVVDSLGKSTLTEIENLRKRNKYLEAAELLSTSAKKTKSTSSSDSSKAKTTSKSSSAKSTAKKGKS